MDHRGIRYEIKMAGGQNRWVWNVHLPKPKQGNISGSRIRAVAAAEKATEQWCFQHPLECEPRGVR